MLQLLILLLRLISALNFSHHEQKYERRVVLRENPESPLIEISKASVNGSGNFLLIVDQRGSKACVFATDDGKLVHEFAPDSTFSDTLAIKGKCPLEGTNYVPSTQATASNPFIKNTIINAVFLNDSVFLGTGSLWSTIEGSNKFNFFSHTSLYYVNVKNKSVQVYPLEWDKSDFAAQSDCLVLNPNGASLMVNTNINSSGALSRHHFDSSICLSTFDFYGKWIRNTKLTLPDECKKYYVGSSSMNPLVTFNKNKELLLGYEAVPRVYNLSIGNSIELSNIPSNNEPFFIAIRNFIQTHPRGTMMPWDSLYSLRPYWLSSITVDSNDNHFITSILRTSEKPWHIIYLIQKYDSSWQYVNSITTKDTKEVEYKYAFYSKEINKIVAIGLLKKKNWVADYFSMTE